jgi:hypothetical protein
VRLGLVVALGAALVIAALPATVEAQQVSRPEPGQARTATAAPQEPPRVRIEDANGASHGRAADPKKAGRSEHADYTFLSSTPGSYARLTRITGRVSYLEHLERGQQYATFRGGLRVALGK